MKKIGEFENSAVVAVAGSVPAAGEAAADGAGSGSGLDPANDRATGVNDLTGSTALQGAPEASLASEAANLLTREVRTAPTLVKYAEPNAYLMETRRVMEQIAGELLAGVPIAEAPLVDLVERTESLEVEIAATLIYEASHHPYRQVRDLVAALPETRVAEIIGVRSRASRPSRRGAPRVSCRRGVAL